MKYIVVQFLETTDVSQFLIDEPVTLSPTGGGMPIPGGKIFALVQTSNPPASLDPTQFAPSKHIHKVPGNSATLTIPATDSGPAI